MIVTKKAGKMQIEENALITTKLKKKKKKNIQRKTTQQPHQLSCRSVIDQ